MIIGEGLIVLPLTSCFR